MRRIRSSRRAFRTSRRMRPFGFQRPVMSQCGRAREAWWTLRRQASDPRPQSSRIQLDGSGTAAGLSRLPASWSRFVIPAGMSGSRSSPGLKSRVKNRSSGTHPARGGHFVEASLVESDRPLARGFVRLHASQRPAARRLFQDPGPPGAGDRDRVRDLRRLFAAAGATRQAPSSNSRASLSNYKQTWADIRKISSAPGAARATSFKSWEYKV